MRLLIICERFFPQRGGLAASAGRIASGIAARGVEAHVFCLVDDLPQGDLETGQWNNILVHRLGKFKQNDRSYMVACRAIELLHRRHPFDALMGMYLVHAGYLAAMEGLLMGVPTLAMARGNDVDREMWRAEHQPFVLGALKWATAVGGVSNELVDKCRLFGGREQVYWTPNSVDAEVFKPGEAEPELRLSLGLGKGPVVGFSGELRFKKGLHHFVEAALRISESKSGAHFLLVGGVREDDREEYERLLKEEPSLKQVLVETPYIKDPGRLAAHYRLMDVLFMPSLWEGMPNAALEAMACGIPVVASDAGGLKDMVEHPKTGLLFPTGDIDAAIESLTAALAMPGDVLRAIGKRAREKVLVEFTLEKESQRILDILNRIVNKNSPSIIV